MIISAASKIKVRFTFKPFKFRNLLRIDHGEFQDWNSLKRIHVIDYLA